MVDNSVLTRCYMKNLVSLLLIGVSVGLFSCDGSEKEKAKKEQSATAFPGTESNRQFTVNSAALQRDFTTWWNYTYHNIKLSQDFVGLAVDSTVIKKADFLYRLTSGRVVPFKVLVRDGMTYYKLYPIDESRTDIKETIKQKAVFEIDHFNREGTSLPDYKFTDIQGKTYSPTTTKGKLVVLKCWYIGCVACVQEFPEVNKLVDRYKERNDILFISLAMDNKEDLVDFLKANELKYATVPKMKDFMQHQLNIGSYPTHILLDKAGKVVKVVDRIDELKPFIDKQSVATSL